jgi:pimeloyl-ACP methyl ester carboxylesterase
MFRHLLPIALLTLTLSAATPDFDKKVEDHYANHDGVKIHYVTIGSGPLIVMVHGWPDFWYTWRDQMQALAPHYRIAAMDLRGFNLSDKPKGVENYAMQFLVGDVVAVIKDAGASSAIVIGHDWGGAISWQLAMARPDLGPSRPCRHADHPEPAPPPRTRP